MFDTYSVAAAVEPWLLHVRITWSRIQPACVVLTPKSAVSAVSMELSMEDSGDGVGICCSLWGIGCSTASATGAVGLAQAAQDPANWTSSQHVESRFTNSDSNCSRGIPTMSIMCLKLSMVCMAILQHDINTVISH